MNCIWLFAVMLQNSLETVLNQYCKSLSYSTPLFYQVKLEQVLGVSATSNNSLSYDPNSENILYTAGFVEFLNKILKHPCFVKSY